MPSYKYAPKSHYDSLPKKRDGVYYIYALHLVGDENCKYVGCTKNPRQRFVGHHRPRPIINHELHKWVQANKGQVRMKILDAVVSDKHGAERLHAQILASEGHQLFNLRAPRRLTREEREVLTAKYLHGE